jgi:hypothetical protein
MRPSIFSKSFLLLVTRQQWLIIQVAAMIASGSLILFPRRILMVSTKDSELSDNNNPK